MGNKTSINIKQEPSTSALAEVIVRLLRAQEQGTKIEIGEGVLQYTAKGKDDDNE